MFPLFLAYPDAIDELPVKLQRARRCHHLSGSIIPKRRYIEIQLTPQFIVHEKCVHMVIIKFKCIQDSSQTSPSAGRNPYKEEDYLQLSGLQHFSYCRRQWALIYIEQQWAENLRTVDGRILHEKAHDATAREKRGDLIVTRDMSVHSPSLGISGSCDVVEFCRGSTGIMLYFCKMQLRYRPTRAKTQ